MFPEIKCFSLNIVVCYLTPNFPDSLKATSFASPPISHIYLLVSARCQEYALVPICHFLLHIRDIHNNGRRQNFSLNFLPPSRALQRCSAGGASSQILLAGR